MASAFTSLEQWQNIAAQVLKLARDKGASDAEITCSATEGFTVNVRLGEVETIEYHRDKAIDMTVFWGNQSGSSSTTDISKTSLENAVSAACSIAKASGSDLCQGLADAALLARDYPNLDLYYPWNIDVNQAIALAQLSENAGRAFHADITNSEGASVNTHEGFHLYANTKDFMGHCFSTRHSLTCILLAQARAHPEKTRDYEFTTARDPHELLKAETIGEAAAQKTLARLGARKLSTRQCPVIFAPSVACRLLGHFASAIQGSHLYRESSFLLNCLEKAIFPDFINIAENPHIPKALGSAPFDSEGVKTSARQFVEKGILKSYSLDSYSARKLGLTTTGNAGGMHNLLIQPTISGGLEVLLKQMHTGLLVTELMGQGVNLVTGDYSRGAAGFWVEQGKIQYPVHEITIAGHLPEMFLRIIAVGDDIDKRGSLWSGAVLIENMTIAGD